MKNKTLLLPGFHLPTLRRKPRSEPQRLADRLQLIREKSTSQLHDCFGPFIPNTLLQTATSGTFSRQRLFTKANTFWGFFTQILNADGGCQEVVRKFQAFAAGKAIKIPSSSTAAYCKARQRCPLENLEQILSNTASELQEKIKLHSFQQRRVIVVDGTGPEHA